MKAWKQSVSTFSHRPTEIFVRSKPSFPQHQAPSQQGNFWAKDIFRVKNAMLFKNSLLIVAKCKLKKKGFCFRFVLNLVTYRATCRHYNQLEGGDHDQKYKMKISKSWNIVKRCFEFGCRVARLSIILLIGGELILTMGKKVSGKCTRLDNNWFCRGQMCKSFPRNGMMMSLFILDRNTIWGKQSWSVELFHSQIRCIIYIYWQKGLGNTHYLSYLLFQSTLPDTAFPCSLSSSFASALEPSLNLFLAIEYGDCHCL